MDGVGEAVAFAAGAFADTAAQGAKAVALGAKQVHQMFGGEDGEVFVGNMRDAGGSYVIPEPLVDSRELKEIDALTERYERLVSPGKLQVAGKAIVEVAPQPVKDVVGKVGGAVEETFNGLTKQELVAGAIQKAAEGFGKLEEQAARASVSRDYVLQRVNDGKQDEKVSELGEICLLRSYDVARVADDERLQHLGLAFVEGGGRWCRGLLGSARKLCAQHARLLQGGAVGRHVLRLRRKGRPCRARHRWRGVLEGDVLQRSRKRDRRLRG